MSKSPRAPDLCDWRADHFQALHEAGYTIIAVKPNSQIVTAWPAVPEPERMCEVTE